MGVNRVFECYEDFEKFVCNRLAALRSKVNLSARDMSLTLGQGQGYINNIENGKNFPSMKSFYYICDFMHISPKDFFDDGTKNPEKLNEVIKDLKDLSDEQLEKISAIIKEIKR